MYTPQTSVEVCFKMGLPEGHEFTIGSLTTNIVPRIGERIYLTGVIELHIPDSLKKYKSTIVGAGDSFRVIDVIYSYRLEDDNDTFIDTHTESMPVDVLVQAI
ncbi:MAG: hypothetical protein HOG49_30380 [Candidatus Scalindua sp.]|nr:hypothetical protein [Candidatus Scalindua sp.]